MVQLHTVEELKLLLKDAQARQNDPSDATPIISKKDVEYYERQLADALARDACALDACLVAIND